MNNTTHISFSQVCWWLINPMCVILESFSRP